LLRMVADGGGGAFGDRRSAVGRRRHRSGNSDGDRAPRSFRSRETEGAGRLHPSGRVGPDAGPEKRPKRIRGQRPAPNTGWPRGSAALPTATARASPM
jgi:hypothetical protein